MEAKQETKSLPRNRKCGNCRYFEPAPLWRKGWCRNPRLYDRRANHLVDASTIDCEQVFRARIYWEPVPTPDVTETQGLISPFAGGSADGGVDAGRNTRIPADGVLRPTINKPVINRKEVVAKPREKTSALPGLVKKTSNIRKWMLENIPYYDKVDGPISRVNWGIVLPTIIIAIALLIIVANLLGGSKKQEATTTPSTTASSATQSGVSGLVGTGGASLTPVSTLNPNATPTLSNALPTATPAPATTTAAATQKKAKVVNTGTAKSVNLRKDTTVKDDKNIIAQVPEGQVVTIVGAPKFAEGREWWQISWNGKTGWASKEFLQEVQ